MHNWPRADYLQVRLGRVKNSISSAQALGTRFHRGGLFLVNREEMASHFKPSQGEDSGSFTFYQGKRLAPQAWGQRPGVKGGGHTFQRKSRLSPSLGARHQRQGLLGAAWLESHPATSASHSTPTPARPQPNCFSFSHNNPPPSP